MSIRATASAARDTAASPASDGTGAPAPAKALSWSAAAAGVLAAGGALAVAELVAVVLRPQAAPVVAIGGEVIDSAPRWLKEFAVETFGTADKPVLIASILVVLAGLAALTGVLALRRPVAGLLGVGLLGVLGAAAAAARPDAGPLDPVPSLAGALAGMAALHLLLRPLAPPRPSVVVADPSRRRFIATAAAVAAGSVAAGLAGRSINAGRNAAAAARSALRLPAPVSPAVSLPAGTDLGIAGLAPFTTPNSDFYRIDTALIVPQVTTKTWRLRVHGMVDREIEVTYDQLIARDLVERDVTLTCVSNEVGGPYVGNARWLGAPLADLLREAGPSPDADMILSTSTDGMTIGTPTAVVLDGRDALLAIAMNGEPLPAEHGFPVRMVVPGLYGYVSATKWLVDLELTRFDRARAYWSDRGWSAKGPIKTMSRIDTPKPRQRVAPGRVAVAGVAWAQHRGVDRVEVRVDGGAWRAARLAEVPSTDTWRQWVWAWDAPPGEHTLEVRATDATGTTQTGDRVDVAPNGATGWHARTVVVG